MRAYTSADESDIEKLGDIGELKGGASDHAIIWKVVNAAHVSLTDIENEWTFDRLLSFNAFLQMNSSYRSAWQEFYNRKKD